MYEMAKLHGLLRVYVAHIPQVTLVDFYLKNLCVDKSDEDVTSKFRTRKKKKKDVDSMKALLDDFEAAETVVLKPLLPKDEGLEDEGFEYEGFEDEGFGIDAFEEAICFDGLPLEMSSLAEKGKPSSLKKGKHSSLEKGKHSSLEKGKPSSLEMSSLEEISSV
ncbi:hypothetical protein Tco_1128365 [Tanacetum coccineum]